ncbi:MAG: 16S rRNA (adenine(1518)-N(6)/adenine(1519)-N(6))-dimethyltransferase RsmA [Syntrophales bacterium]
MESVRTTLARYDIRPRKRFGQSFLADQNTIRRIAALDPPGQEETVVEIGAGLGLLTAELARTAARVIALEIDPRLVSALRDRFADDPAVEIVPGDVLDYDFSQVSPGGKVMVVGNIPYHISTPILFHLLKFRQAISRMVLMLQKELADRITATPGGKEYGIPSVLIARYAVTSRELNVSPACFYPEPKVVSSVVRVEFRGDRGATPAEEALFSRTVRSAFAQRRKTLRNNLRAAGFPEEVLEGVLERAGIQGTRRAETLTVDEYGVLAGELAKIPGAGKPLDNRSGI